MVVFFISFVFVFTDYSLKIKLLLPSVFAQTLISMYDFMPLCAFVGKY